MQAPGHLRGKGRIVGGEPQKAERLHGKRAACPGRGREQMQGLGAFDDDIVARAEPFAQPAVISHHFVQHADPSQLRSRFCRGSGYVCCTVAPAAWLEIFSIDALWLSASFACLLKQYCRA